MRTPSRLAAAHQAAREERIAKAPTAGACGGDTFCHRRPPSAVDQMTPRAPIAQPRAADVIQTCSSPTCPRAAAGTGTTTAG